MKILVATGLYFPDIGGPATYVAMLEKHLPNRGFELEVVPFRAVRSYPKVVRHVMYLWRVWRAAGEVDLVYALDPVSVGLPAAIVARLRGKKFMLRLGGDYAWEQGRVRFGVTDTLDEYTANPKHAAFPVRILAWLQTWVSKRALVVVAPSEYLKGIITTWGVTPARVQVIYSSLVPLVPNQAPEQTLATYNAGAPTVVTACRLVPWKGIRVLIEAIVDLREQFPGVTLLVAGDGPEREVLEAQIAKHGAASYIRLLGRLDKQDLANVKKAADVFVLNTAYEGLSHELLEVMDLGIPIVTTPAGGNVELFSDGVDALLVPFNDQERLQQAITTLVTNSETSHRLTQFARARSKDFTEEKVISDLVLLVTNIHEA